MQRSTKLWGGVAALIGGLGAREMFSRRASGAAGHAREVPAHGLWSAAFLCRARLRRARLQHAQ